MNHRLITLVIASVFAVLLSANRTDAAILLYAAWDLNEGAGTTTTQHQLPAGHIWNQATNPNATLAATASADFSTVPGTAFGPASPAPNSTASLTVGGTGVQNELNSNVSGAGLAGTGAKTFVAWINPTGLDTNGSGILSYSPRGGQTNGADLRFLLDDNGDLRAEVTGGAFVFDSTSHVNDGWKMVAAIFDSNTNLSSFYISGVGIVAPTTASNRAIDTSGTEGNGDSEINIVLGGTQANNRSFLGGLDMAAIYTGAATEAELDAIFLNGIAIEDAFVIPEPTTAALIALAGLTLTRRRRIA